MNKVIILFPGYSYPEPMDEKIQRANCSCTLIKTSTGLNIIVDTMTAWNGEALVQKLAEHHTKPKDIDYVICTHGHSDHIGCNYLFPEAKWHFVGNSISHRDQYFEWPETKEENATGSRDDNKEDEGVEDFLDDTTEREMCPYEIDDSGVTIYKTPGHTMSCVSIVVKNTEMGIVGVCGDLFERAEDIEDDNIWIEAGSDNKRLQRLNRFRMAKLCDYIIPGHGVGFPMTKHILNILRRNTERSFDYED